MSNSSGTFNKPFQKDLQNFIENFNYNGGPTSHTALPDYNPVNNCNCLDCVAMQQLKHKGYIQGSACKTGKNQCSNCNCQYPKEYTSVMHRGYTVCPFGFAQQQSPSFNCFRGNIIDDQLYLDKYKSTGSNGTPQLGPRPMTRIGTIWRN